MNLKITPDYLIEKGFFDDESNGIYKKGTDILDFWYCPQTKTFGRYAMSTNAKMHIAWDILYTYQLENLWFAITHERL